MLLPSSDSATLLTIALAALLWGSWAHTQRADRKWRFELYAFDFAIGAVIAVLVLALTLGNSGSSNTFTFEDNLTVGSKRNMAAALGGGALYGIGQMMIFSAVALAGMGAAIPLAAAVGIIVSVATRAIMGPVPHPSYLYGGAAAALVTLLISALAHKSAAAAAPVKTGIHPAWKGYTFACIGGLFTSLALFAVESTRGGDIGLGSYGSTVFMAVGVLLAVPLAAVFFLNLPVQGEAISLLQYFHGKISQHLLGLLGGTIWVAGTLAFYSAVGASFENAPSLIRVVAASLGGAAVVSLAGMFLWSEQAAAPKARLLSMAASAVLAAGASLIYFGA